MLDVEREGYFQHVVPTPTPLRVFLVICGLFVIVVATLSLWQGVWPLNLTSPFFALLLAGAFSVGGPVMLAGIAAPATRWTVERGRLRIELTNPFRTTVETIQPADVEALQIRKFEGDGEDTWAVEGLLASGKKVYTRQLGSEAAAHALRAKIQAVYRG